MEERDQSNFYCTGSESTGTPQETEKETEEETEEAKKKIRKSISRSRTPVNCNVTT